MTDRLLHVWCPAAGLRVRLRGLAALLGATLAFTPALAEGPPPELASLAAELLRATKGGFQDPAFDAEHAQIAAGAEALLRQQGLYRWGHRAVVVPDALAKGAEALGVGPLRPGAAEAVQALLTAPQGDLSARQETARALLAAQGVARPDDTQVAELLDKVPKARERAFGEVAGMYEMTASDGGRIELEVMPGPGKMFIRTFDPTGDQGRPALTVVEGDITLRPRKDGGGTELAAVRDGDPISPLTMVELEAAFEDVLGEWVEADGTLWIMEESGGAPDPQGAESAAAEQAAAALAAKRTELAEMKSRKVYLWKNPETDETVEQTRFKRLAEPFVFAGVQEAAPAQVAKLEAEIATLESTQGQRKQPIGTAPGFRGRDLPHALVVQIVLASGHRRTFTPGQYSLGLIEARGRVTHVLDIGDLPKSVIKQLAEEWRPQQWLTLRAIRGHETGEVQLVGHFWSLHVTYDADSKQVEDVQGPWSRPLTLRRTQVEVAQGGRFPEEGP